MAKLLNTLGPNSGAEFLWRSIDVILFNELGSPGPGEAAEITELTPARITEMTPRRITESYSYYSRAAATSCSVFRHGEAAGNFFGWFSGKNQS
tara:strand:+ start:195 stop:476 length:282 start_codon:yes stop_codon:yes gene_type:complete